MTESHNLKDTKWLAEKLGLSVTTIEKRRAEKPDELPQHINIGKTIRYDECFVNTWIQAKMKPNSPAITKGENSHEAN